MPDLSKLVFPVGTICSKCHKVIQPEGTPKNLKEHFAALEKAFAQHVKEKHSGEDVNQAAARIVREATGR
jgi:hypothetical protein